MSDHFEAFIRDVAKHMAYPPMPVKERVIKPTYRRRLLRYVLLLVLIVGFASFAIPDIRAAVLDFLKIGVVTIYLDGRTEDGQRLNLDAVSGETTLAEAQSQVDFDIFLPPDDPPDRVFVQDRGLIILVWIDDDRIERALYQTVSDEMWHIFKTATESVEKTRVGDDLAFWMNFQHPVEFVRQGVVQEALTYFVDGKVLIWERDRLTLRLETHATRDEARTFAASLVPMS